MLDRGVLAQVLAEAGEREVELTVSHGFDQLPFDEAHAVRVRVVRRHPHALHDIAGLGRTVVLRHREQECLVDVRTGLDLGRVDEGTEAPARLLDADAGVRSCDRLLLRALLPRSEADELDEEWVTAGPRYTLLKGVVLDRPPLVEDGALDRKGDVVVRNPAERGAPRAS